MLNQTIDNQVYLGAQRWLHSLNINPMSKAYGVADREYWAWKVKDFGNGTWQGGLSGFLDSLDLLDFSDDEVKKVVYACIYGCLFLQRKDGSFEEAYPYESSYAVTALVQFNVLYSYLVHPRFFDNSSRQLLLDFTEKSNRFLKNTSETHGIISNHLITGLLARVLYSKFTDDVSYTQLACDAVTEITNHMCLEEGWFPEYGGADGGYQSLLNHYWLAFVKCTGTVFPYQLFKSQGFIENFLFPDGSFCGEVGSRGTTIVYPSGLSAASYDWFLTKHLVKLDITTPTNVDSGNFVPIFTSWSLFRKNLDTVNHLPILDADLGVKEFTKARIVVVKSEESYLALSTNNGVIRKVNFIDGKWVDQSIAAFKRGDLSTQLGEVAEFKHSAQEISFWLTARRINSSLNNVVIAIGVRVLSFICSPLPILQLVLKRMLILGVSPRAQNRPVDTKIKVSIDLKSSDLSVTISGNTEFWQRLSSGFHTHMASANTFCRRSLN